MFKETHVRAIAVSLWLAWLAVGCAGSGGKSAKLHVPPGLDSVAVVQSDKIASKTFVSSEQEKQAEQLTATGKQELDKVDEFWNYLEQRVQQSKLSGEQQKQFDRELSQGAAQLAKWKTLTKNGSDAKALQNALQYCQSAREHLEQALRLNPFDKNARALLAATYYNLQYMFGQEGNYERSAYVLERLTRIERGEHSLFRMLGESYMNLEQYNKALRNFKKAQSVLLATSYDAPPDTSMLFYYTYMQADMYARLHNAQEAMNHFKLARTFARKPDEKADVDNYIKWIQWDNGNIQAAELWDKVLSYESAKEYRKMENTCHKLLPILRTRRAKFAVQNKLAVVEFEYLGKKDKAADRIYWVYKSLGPEVRNPKRSKETQQYLNTFGAMLYRLGVDALKNQKKRMALAYFNKATEFEWDQVAKPYIELVTLLWNDPTKAIYFGEKALTLADGSLSSKESCELLSMMVKAHKSAGNYNKAREYFRMWKQCQQEGK